MSVERVCAYEDCGQTFTVRAPSRRGTYCSTTCAGKARSARFAQPDPYDILHAELRREQRVERWLPLLDALAHSVRCRDRRGVQVLWEKAVRAGDQEAFFTAAGARIAQLEDTLAGEKTAPEGVAAA